MPACMACIDYRMVLMREAQWLCRVHAGRQKQCLLTQSVSCAVWIVRRPYGIGVKADSMHVFMRTAMSATVQKEVEEGFYNFVSLAKQLQATHKQLGPVLWAKLMNSYKMNCTG